MTYSIGSTGRVVVARFEHGDPIYATIEQLAANESIHSAVVWLIGGITRAGVVVGPEDDEERPPRTVVEHFDDAREVLAIGTVFTDPEGAPRLHMHAAIGRRDKALVGCPREGAECWLVDEVVILEILDTSARRAHDPQARLTLLRCDARE